MKILQAQIQLLAALTELTALRRSIRLRGMGMEEWRHKSTRAGTTAATEWIETTLRLDREFASRLAKLRNTVNKALHLLPPPGASAAKP